ncbi:MAG: hypothetical protein DMF91_15165 [Acidobacteria bacterium]|nr:MAG: hypothetical protein DMF91_15165 [Acidobacteriota bacterium]
MVVVDQPHTARVVLALFDHRLRQRSEEALDVRLAHQQIQRELDNLSLDLRAALSAATLTSLANQGGAEHFRIAGLGFFRLLVSRVRGFTRRVVAFCFHVSLRCL